MKVDDYPTRLHSARSLYRELTAGPLVKQRSRFWQWLDSQKDPQLTAQIESLLGAVPLKDDQRREPTREGVTAEELRSLVISAVGWKWDVFTEDL